MPKREAPRRAGDPPTLVARASRIRAHARLAAAARRPHEESSTTVARMGTEARCRALALVSRRIEAAPMKMRRPRTLLGLVLLGLAFVTVPLLIAIGNAVHQARAARGRKRSRARATAPPSTLQNREARVAAHQHGAQRAHRICSCKDVVALGHRSLLTLYDSDQAAFEASLAALTPLPKDRRHRASSSPALVDLEGSALRTACAAVRREQRRNRHDHRALPRDERGGSRRRASGMRATDRRAAERAPREHALGAARARLAVRGADPRHARSRRAVPAARRPADAAGRPRDSRARRRRLQPADHRQRPERHRDASAASSSGCACASRTRRTRRTSSCATCRTS